jgi:beta-glucosidase
VDFWSTHNEPYVISFLGYSSGVFPPRLADASSAYLCAHNLLLSHGKAVQVFRQGGYKGKIGLVNCLVRPYPGSDREDDVRAAELAFAQEVELFLSPVFKGEYPGILMDWLHSMAPEIRDGDMEIISQPLDYFGVNYYFSYKVFHDPLCGLMKYRTDFVDSPMWDRTEMGWGVYADGLRQLLVDIKQNYGDIPLYVTENGTAVPDKPEKNGFVNDQSRIKYFKEHLLAVHAAVEQGVDVRGYYAWSLMDNFEWLYGYRPRFGLVRVDYDNMKRIPKQSALWYSDVIKRNAVCL